MSLLTKGSKSARKRPVKKVPDDLAMDLLQLCLDLAGIADPSPACDGANAIISIVRGNWFDAAISGLSIIPYVGDLAKIGRLKKQLKSIKRAIKIVTENPELATKMIPVFRKLKAALDWLPNKGSEHLADVKLVVHRFLQEYDKIKNLPKHLPDWSKRFHVREIREGEFVRIKVVGDLGVPGKVKTHRNPTAQKHLHRTKYHGKKMKVQPQKSDEAGHMIGNQFGAPGNLENLVPMSFHNNRKIFGALERKWAKLLEEGNGIRVEINAIRKAGTNRPFGFSIKWRQILPDGSVRTFLEKPSGFQ